MIASILLCHLAISHFTFFFLNDLEPDLIPFHTVSPLAHLAPCWGAKLLTIAACRSIDILDGQQKFNSTDILLSKNRAVLTLTC